MVAIGLAWAGVIVFKMRDQVWARLSSTPARQGPAANLAAGPSCYARISSPDSSGGSPPGWTTPSRWVARVSTT